MVARDDGEVARPIEALIAGSTPSITGYTATMRELLPEEETVGSDDPSAQAEAILDESDQRTVQRDATPSSRVEHRTSDEATPPA